MPTHRSLREAVGSLLFVWAQLERALRREVAVLDPEAQPRGIAQLIAAWSAGHAKRLNGRPSDLDFVNELAATMVFALDIRNRLAHGICGWSVDEAGWIETELNGTVTRTTLADLHAVMDRINTLSSHLPRVTSFSIQPARCRHSDLHGEIRAMMNRSLIGPVDDTE